MHGAAVSEIVFAASGACGQCLRITDLDTSQAILAHVVDICHECDGEEVALPPPSFAALGAGNRTAVRVSWTGAFCSDTPGPLTYHFKAGSTRRHAYLQLLNNALPIDDLVYTDRFGTDHVALRTSNNFFELHDIGFKTNITLLAHTSSQRAQEVSSAIFFRSSASYFLAEAQFLPVSNLTW